MQFKSIVRVILRPVHVEKSNRQNRQRVQILNGVKATDKGTGPLCRRRVQISRTQIILKEWDDNLSVGPSKRENWID